MNVIKKTVAIAVSVATLVCLCTANFSFASAAASETRFVGDVNNDGKVDAVDASTILNYYASLSVGNEVNIDYSVCDFNHDGSVNAVDASAVLSVYASMSTQIPVKLEAMYNEPIAKEEKNFAPNDIIEFVQISWYIHTTPELGSFNVYGKKNTLNKGDLCVINRVLPESWYGVYLDGSREEVYIRIEEIYKDYFKKFGYIVVTGENTTTTTAITTVPTTTSTTTAAIPTTTVDISVTEDTLTSTSSTTTTTDTTTTTTTTIPTTTPETTVTTASEQNKNYFENMEAVEFIGTWWNIRSSFELTEDNKIGHLAPNEIFFIKKAYGNDWYSIISVNMSETEKYIKISEEDRHNFKSTGWNTAVFYGDRKDIRASKFEDNDYNIYAMLKSGDAIMLSKRPANGWWNVYSNKVRKMGVINGDEGLVITHEENNHNDFQTY